jgi:hypothetical protein
MLIAKVEEIDWPHVLVHLQLEPPAEFLPLNVGLLSRLNSR